MAERKVEEPRRAFLEELEGPPQFRPWVAGPEIMPKISILGEERIIYCNTLSNQVF